MANIFDVPLYNSIVNPRTPAIGIETLNQIPPMEDDLPYAPEYGEGFLMNTTLPYEQFLTPKIDMGAMGVTPQLAQNIPTTFSSLPPNLGVVNQPNEETEEYEVDQFGYRKEPNKLGGILDLLAGIAIPGYGIFKNVAQGGFEGLRGLGGRLGQSDFAQSKTHMDFLDRIRNRNTGTNDISAADIQTEMANRSSAAQTDQDRNRGDRPGGANYSAPSGPSRASSYRDSSSFGKSFHG